MNWLFAFRHHAAAFALVAALAVGLVLVRDELTLRTARRLIVADAVYGIAAGTLAGVLLILLCAAMMARGVGYLGA